MEDNFIKITNAVYKVLDFFPDGDPLKNKAKEKALAILENSTLIFDNNGWLSLKTYLSQEREKVKTQILDDINILETYLKLGKYQGWVNNMNFLILTKEYDKIKSEINRSKGLVDKDIEITLKVVKEDKKTVREKQEFNVNNSQLTDIKNSVSGSKQSERQRKILEILVKTEKAQVSDLIKELPNITKRTVRRDLDSLLKRGKIIRIGEWNQVFYQISKGATKNQKNIAVLDRT